MRFLHTNAKSILSQSPTSGAGSDYPNYPDYLSTAKHRVTKKLIVRTTGLLAILSLLGIGSAADRSATKATSTNHAQVKSATVDLNRVNKIGGSTGTDPPAASNGSLHASVNSSSTTSSSGGSSSSNENKSSFSVTVNGQQIDVPGNGTNQQVITTPDGSTTVTVTNNSSGQGTDSSTNFSANATTRSNSSRNTNNQDTHIEQVQGSP